jgi:hypothetical protein
MNEQKWLIKKVTLMPYSSKDDGFFIGTIEELENELRRRMDETGLIYTANLIDDDNE